MQYNILIGRITKDLDEVRISGNTKILNLQVAVRNGKDDTTFLKIITFNQTAENCKLYLKKGSLISVIYSIKNHNWEDKNGVKHYDLDFIASRVVFLDAKKEEKQEVKKVEEDPFEAFGNSIEVDDNMLE